MQLGAGPSRGRRIAAGDERADEGGVGRVGDGDRGELPRLRGHADGAGEEEEDEEERNRARRHKEEEG